jgi:endoglucanase
MRAYLRSSLGVRPLRGASLRASFWITAFILGLGVLGHGCGGGSDGSGSAGAAGGSTGAGGGFDTSYDPDFTIFEAKRLKVSGNKLVDPAGTTVRLLGINRAGSEYMCVKNTGKVFDGSTGPNSIAAMLTWNINTVRLPLNESCWLGLAGAGAQVPPESYQQEIVDYVWQLHNKGLYVVLDLHWSSTSALATKQTTMADAANAPAFWSSVAARFKSDPMVIFDLYNEPILDDNNQNPAQGDAWACWQNGCTTREGWATAGMQQMLTAVRSAGANQVVIATGLNWGSKLDGWLTHKPTDPMNNLMAAFHVYNNNGCGTSKCWTNAPTTVAAQVPVVTGEMGEHTCVHSFIDPIMAWADNAGVGYLGWGWNVQDCNTFPALITNVDGTATEFGKGLKDHLATLPPQH